MRKIFIPSLLEDRGESQNRAPLCGLDIDLKWSSRRESIFRVWQYGLPVNNIFEDYEKYVVLIHYHIEQ